jgi:predicted MPP superfamily phosphohydrolase
MLVFIILLLTDIYIWRRLFTDLRQGNKILWAAVFTVKAITSFILLYLIIRLLFYKGEFADPANAFRYLAFGAIAALIVTVALSYLFTGIVNRLIEKVFHRKLRGLIIANLVISGALLLLLTDSYLRQRFDLRVVRQEITISNLDSRLDGLKIVLISDLHLCSWQGHYNRLAGVISSINAEKPDLLFNVGDFINFGWQEFGGCDTILRKARTVSGAFAVLGNHDDGTYYPHYDETYGQECAAMLSGKISASGYTLLSDTTVVINHNGAEIAISGIVTHGHHLNMYYGDFDKAFDLIPDSVFSLMLVHDPAAWDVAAQDTRMPQLAISGHTHGAQVGLPLPRGYISPVSLYDKRWKGLYSNDGKYLYVTTGLGTMGMALRIFMPPEIVVITLRR